MILDIIKLMEKKERIQGIGVLFSLIIGAVMELVGVSAILPLVNLMIDPESIDNYSFLLTLKHTLNINSNQLLLSIIIGLMVIYIVKNIYIMLMYRIQFAFTYSNQYRLAKRIFHNYVSQNYLYHTEKNVAEIQRDLDKDVFNFYAVVLACIQLFEEVLVALLLVVYLAITDIFTTVAVVAIAFVFLIVTTIVAKKRLIAYGEKGRLSFAETTKWVLQTFAGIKEVKVSNSEAFFEQMFCNAYQNFVRNQKKAKYFEILPKPIMEMACMIALLLPLAFRLQLGDVGSKFITTISVFGVAAIRLLPCFNRMSMYLNTISQNKSTVDSISRCKNMEICIDRAEMKEGKCELLKFKEYIDLKNLTFMYPKSENFVLKKIYLQIKKNTSIGFIGPSGAGKTTLVDLILGLLKPSDGEILVDGISIWDELNRWHNTVAYIPQNIYLMDDTIRNNVLFGIEDVSNDEQIRKSLADAQLLDFVESLEEGLDTVIGDRGVRLSGGQRQRIGIARALYRKPQVLILDEATSALDNATETAVMDAIDVLQGKMTIIIVAHRLTTVSKCDYIYEVKNQKVTPFPKEALKI